MITREAPAAVAHADEVGAVSDLTARGPGKNLAESHQGAVILAAQPPEPLHIGALEITQMRERTTKGSQPEMQRSSQHLRDPRDPPAARFPQSVPPGLAARRAVFEAAEATMVSQHDAPAETLAESAALIVSRIIVHQRAGIDPHAPVLLHHHLAVRAH